MKAKGEYGTFKIGTGFTEGQRDALWANRDTIVEQLVKYKCAEKGVLAKNVKMMNVDTELLLHDEDFPNSYVHMAHPEEFSSSLRSLCTIPTTAGTSCMEVASHVYLFGCA